MRFITWIYLQLRHNTLVTFFIGGLIIWGVEQFASDFVRSRGWTGFALFVVAIALALLVFQAGRDLLYRLLPRDRPPAGPSPSPHRGMILLLGRADAALFALDHHPNLDYLWMVVTARSRDEVEAMSPRLPGRVVTSREWIHNAYDQGECANAVERAVSHARTLGLTADDLICDLTGGTTAMTVGAFQACQQAGIAAQMVTARYDKERKHPVPDAVIALDTRCLTTTD